MKILITGAEGQLGKNLIYKKPFYINDKKLKIILASKKDLDLSNEFSCKDFILKNKPDWIINCGAYTNVDNAENKKELANLINGKGPYFLAKYLSYYGGKLLHISSDFVFDGNSNEAYEISHPINPINAYGKSKALAEELLLNDNNFKNIHIIRTSWLISNIGNNFLIKILKLISEKDVLNVVNDQIGCVTSATNLAEICWKLIKLENNGIKIPNILHFSDSGICTWFDLASTIYEFINEKGILKKNIEIIPVKSNFFNLPAKRPKFSLLNSQETYKILNFTPTHWRKSINLLLDSLDKNILTKLKDQ